MLIGQRNLQVISTRKTGLLYCSASLILSSCLFMFSMVFYSKKINNLTSGGLTNCSRSVIECVGNTLTPKNWS